MVERGRGLANVDVSLDGTTWSSATVVDEMWDIAFGMLSERKYDLYVRAFDKAGNMASIVILGIIVDSEPPWILLYGEAPTATNEPILHLEGWTEPGAVLYLGQMVIEPDEAGNFTIDYPLSEGANGLVLRVMDIAGNWNQTVMSVLLDSIAPFLTVLTPGPGLNTNDPVVEFSGRTDTDATVLIDGVEVTTYKGGFRTDLDLSEGTHDILVEAIDLAGNTAAVSITVIIDLTPPTLGIDRPTEPTFTTIDDTAFIAGRMDADLDYVFINGENRSALPGEFAIQVDLVEGENTFTVTAIDHAGNTQRIVVTIIRDTRAPTYSIEDVSVLNGSVTRSGSDRFTTKDTLVFSVSVNEEAVFSVNGVTHQDKGQFSFEHTLDEGSNVINIDVADLMGNLADPYHYTIIYDPVPPNVVVISPSDGFETDLGDIQITGVTEDSRSQVWVDDVPAGVLADGSFKLTVILEWGDNLFTIRSRDRAGNEAETTLTIVRREKEEVQESNAGSMVIALVVGLVIGVAIMFVWGKSQRGSGPTDMEEPPVRSTPPPPPSEGPEGPGGPKGPDDNWSEYR